MICYTSIISLMFDSYFILSTIFFTSWIGSEMGRMARYHDQCTSEGTELSFCDRFLPPPSIAFESPAPFFVSYRNMFSQDDPKGSIFLAFFLPLLLVISRLLHLVASFKVLSNVSCTGRASENFCLLFTLYAVSCPLQSAFAILLDVIASYLT